MFAVYMRPNVRQKETVARLLVEYQPRSNVEHWLDSQLYRARKIDQFKGKTDQFKGKIDRFKDKIDRFKGKIDRFKGETDQWKQAERLGDRAKSLSLIHI